METTPGPAHLVLMTSVARAFYLDRKSKVEIAAEFRLSRFKVARLLDAAHEAGIVQIEIGHAGGIELDLSSRLRSVFGLTHSIVVDTPEVDPPTLRRAIGGAAAALLSEILTADDVLGLAEARSVSAMCAQLTRLPACEVVQLTGALSQMHAQVSSIELAREAARVAGGPAYWFYAPLIVPEAATARALRQQPEVARALAQISTVTTAVVGVGAWTSGESTLFDAIDPTEQRRLHRLGVCADVSGVLLDQDGTAIDAPLRKRMIGITAEQMREIPDVIAIVYGRAKAGAVHAALTGGYVTSIVTHSPLARDLLAVGS